MRAGTRTHIIPVAMSTIESINHAYTHTHTHWSMCLRVSLVAVRIVHKTFALVRARWMLQMAIFSQAFCAAAKSEYSIRVCVYIVYIYGAYTTHQNRNGALGGQQPRLASSAAVAFRPRILTMSRIHRLACVRVCACPIVWHWCMCVYSVHVYRPTGSWLCANAGGR